MKFVAIYGVGEGADRDKNMIPLEDKINRQRNDL